MAVSGCGTSGRAVSVFPVNGALTASPRTQISVRGAQAGELSDFAVGGSRSGEHAGHWRGHADRRGASFVPDAPFERGEAVTVRVGRRVAGVRGEEIRFRIAGAPGGRPGPVARPAKRPWRGVQRFGSRPDLQPPAIEVLHPAQDADEGAVFVAPKVGPSQIGPMIVDASGELVWFHPLKGTDQAFDFRVQRSRGKPALTWWQGPLSDFHGRGAGYVYDTYRRVATVRAGNGYQADLHEFELIARGTAWIAAYVPVPWDLSAMGGRTDGTVYDQVVQEVEVESGAVLFEWQSLGNIALSESYQPLPEDRDAVWDPVHVNSIDEEPDGNILVSGRHTQTVYEIDRRTGKVRWRLGGKRSSFHSGGGTLFAWQHDARRRQDGTISLYDNAANAVRPHRESRGLIIDLDEKARTAGAVREFKASPSVLGPTQGNVQTLPSGDVMVGWGGTVPRFTEFDADGAVTFDARFLTPGAETYRAYRMPWSATPPARPSIAVREVGARALAFVSWNGATTVAR